MARLALILPVFFMVAAILCHRAFFREPAKHKSSNTNNVAIQRGDIMKRSQRLEPVIRVAENREQQAARSLGDSQSALHQAQQRLDELKNYREEYIQRFHANGAVGMSAVQMADYRLFLSNLSRAVEQQAGLVQQALVAVEKQRQLWFTRRGKVKMLGNVVSRFQADERRAVDRKEQREQDDEHTRRIPGTLYRS